MIIKNKMLSMAIACLCIVGFSVLAVGDTPDREVDKANRAAALQQTKFVGSQGSVSPEVAAKLALEAETQAKLEAEIAAQIEEQNHAQESPEQLKTAQSPLAAQDLKRNPHQLMPAMPAYTLRTELLFEGFESGVVPPAGWSSVVNNIYTWEIDTFDPYEGSNNASCFYDDTYSGTQDEWLTSPVLDLTARAAYNLQFAWLGSYYWSVDPNDNCELEVWLSTDGGTTFPTLLWYEDQVGVFDNWTWYTETVDLSAYSSETNVVIGFRYYGFDGAQFSLDAISINDNALPVGRCCYGDPGAPSCADTTEAACDALSGSWTFGLNCNDNPCPLVPDNDECTEAEVVPGPFPAVVNGTTEGATIDCPGVLDWNAVWYQFEATKDCNDITIDFCGSPYEIQCVGIVLYSDCNDCNAYILSDYEFLDCEGLTQPRMTWENLPMGTYYFPVFVGDIDCLPVESPFQFTVDIVECPPAVPGDNCTVPFVASFGSGDLPYTVANQYTCGRDNTYDLTCLGSYDGGEDFIMELTVNDNMFVNISLDPKGTTWTGMSIADACPDNGGVCLGSVSSSSGSLKTIPNMALSTGVTYYIMVDTWPTPDCIPDFDIIFEASAGPSEGDNCSNPIKIDIPTLPYHDYGQTTCGRVNDYSATCLGSYDGGEDIIYEITVASSVTVNITLDPLGTTYSGMALAAECPPGGTCLYQVGTSSSAPKGFKCVNLDPGVYYLMIDTWPTPDCIPAFDLHIVDTNCAALENDDCVDAEAIGDVTNMPFSTSTATFDGPGGCQTAGNVWYCYTASCTGKATFSLCGSSYDTKIAVYDGCDCPPTVMLACNDDACGLQSEVEVNVVAGNTYLIEVGGYASNTGDGFLTVSCAEPCQITCSGTAEGEACIPDDGEDVTNGGCNSVPPVFGSIGCGETVCGQWNTYLFGASQYRDTDWYLFSLTENSDVTITAVGEFPIVTGFLEQLVPGGGVDCGNFTGYIAPYGTAAECETLTVTQLGMAPGDYAIFVGGTVYTGYPCPGPYDYSVSVECVPAVPTYCAASGGCDEYIENVTFGSINNTTGCDGYGDYTALSTVVEPGSNYPISITLGNSYSLDTGAVWVDWNQDLDFDDAGELGSLSPGLGYGPYSGTISVPNDALAGTTRMRVRMTYNTTPTPCGAHTYGEVEDYTVQVGEPGATYLYSPDPFYSFMKFSLDPVSGCIYVSSYAGGGDVTQWENVMLAVDGCNIPIASTEIVAGYGELTGDVLKICFNVGPYIVCEETHNGGPLFDWVESFFDITYDIGGSPDSWGASLMIRGHVSGDLNLDRSCNIADVTFMVAYLFQGGEAPLVPETGDVDASGGINVADLTYLVAYLFQDGPSPLHP
jgi:hypothetical protein